MQTKAHLPVFFTLLTCAVGLVVWLATRVPETEEHPIATTPVEAQTDTEPPRDEVCADRVAVRSPAPDTPEHAVVALLEVGARASSDSAAPEVFKRMLREQDDRMLTPLWRRFSSRAASYLRGTPERPGFDLCHRKADGTSAVLFIVGDTDDLPRRVSLARDETGAWRVSMLGL